MINIKTKNGINEIGIYNNFDFIESMEEFEKILHQSYDIKIIRRFELGECYAFKEELCIPNPPSYDTYIKPLIEALGDIDNLLLRIDHLVYNESKKKIQINMLYFNVSYLMKVEEEELQKHQTEANQ